MRASRNSAALVRAAIAGTPAGCCQRPSAWIPAWIASFLAASRFIPGWNRLAATMPRETARIMLARKKATAFSPTRPSFFRSAKPAVAPMIETAISGMAIIFSSWMKMSPSGLT